MSRHEAPKQFAEAKLTEVNKARTQKRPSDFFVGEKRVTPPIENGVRFETTTHSGFELKFDSRPQIEIPPIQQKFDEEKDPWNYGDGYILDGELPEDPSPKEQTSEAMQWWKAPVRWVKNLTSGRQLEKPKTKLIEKFEKRGANA